MNAGDEFKPSRALMPKPGTYNNEVSAVIKLTEDMMELMHSTVERWGTRPLQRQSLVCSLKCLDHKPMLVKQDFADCIQECNRPLHEAQAELQGHNGAISQEADRRMRLCLKEKHQLPPDATIVPSAGDMPYEMLVCVRRRHEWLHSKLFDMQDFMLSALDSPQASKAEAAEALRKELAAAKK